MSQNTTEGNRDNYKTEGVNETFVPTNSGNQRLPNNKKTQEVLYERIESIWESENSYRRR